LDEFESLCKRCGRCCELKEKAGEYYKLTGQFCSHLRQAENGKSLCDIYHDRNGVRLNSKNVCVPSDIAVICGDLPPDCPYAKLMYGYKTRVIDWMPKGELT